MASRRERLAVKSFHCSEYWSNAKTSLKTFMRKGLTALNSTTKMSPPQKPKMTHQRYLSGEAFLMVSSVMVARSRRFFNGCSKLVKNLLFICENKLY